MVLLVWGCVSPFHCCLLRCAGWGWGMGIDARDFEKRLWD